MSQPSLPLDCLLIVLECLSQEYDTDTLARLLRVNKTMCNATLPYLYKNCFDVRMHGNRPRSEKSATLSMVQLIRTLLQQLPQHQDQSQVPDLLKVAYLRQSADERARAIPPCKPLILYSRFVREIVYPQGGSNPFRNEDIRKNTHITGYVLSKGLQTKYHAEGLPSDIYPAPKGTFLNGLANDLRRQFTWILCQAQPERITALSVPLSDIARYIGHIDRFKSLSKVIFIIDKTVHIPRELAKTPYIKEEDREKRERELSAVRDQAIKDMAEFVDRHVATHPGVLQQALCPCPDTHGFSDIETDLIGNIQLNIPNAPSPPVFHAIDDNNWCEFASQHSKANFQHVESIRLSKTTGLTRGDAILKDPYRRYGDQQQTCTVHTDHYVPDGFLKSCRALQDLEIETLGRDMFQWAVHERESYQGQSSQPKPKALVPLRSVKITYGEPTSSVQELDDIAFGFSTSLERMAAHLEWKTATPGPLPQIVLGKNWSLPRLRELTLSLRCAPSQFCMDLDVLQRSDALEWLELRDNTRSYNHQDIRSWPLIRFPHLKTLKLLGWPALCFNMDSLHHSPDLEFLHLGMEEQQGQLFFIPPPNVLQRQTPGESTLTSQDTLGGTRSTHGATGPTLTSLSTAMQALWTWDWHLPSLRDLKLDAVFAFIFDFQWLQKLPNLHSFALNIESSVKGTHGRTLTMKELQTRKQPQDEVEKNSDSEWYIRLPKLQSITLKGEWHLDVQILEVLCLVVAPKLENVHLGVSCTGFTLQEWASLFRRVPHLQNSRWERLCLPREIHQLGLKSIQDVPEVDHVDGRLWPWLQSGRPKLHWIGRRVYWDDQVQQLL
ncbi:MAG: hypothetical protein J3Q66DRAFT_333494 [Benniella sp.]|nr:MAG: hypothetical protein J3Q66DRAFT_333494 [Benniella sp.]